MAATIPGTASSGSILGRTVDILARVSVASLLSFACITFWGEFQRTGKWTPLLWMASEGLVAALIVLRRRSTSLSRRPGDWISGIAGTFLVLLVRPTGEAILPDAAGSALMACGSVLQICAKAALGRGFGIVAANRGIVRGGPYRFVRHPIYLGYLVTHVGFLASNWSGRNLAVYGATWFFQAARIFAEERLLSEDGTYRAYARTVRYRLVPGIF
jgi:protein-S-isoprenylcysteine O-methyltransferase Ste14